MPFKRILWGILCVIGLIKPLYADDPSAAPETVSNDPLAGLNSSVKTSSKVKINKIGNGPTRLYEQGGTGLYDGSFETTGKVQADRFFELIGVSTGGISTPPARHARLYLDNTAKRYCAKFDDGSTMCLGTSTGSIVPLNLSSVEPILYNSTTGVISLEQVRLGTGTVGAYVATLVSPTTNQITVAGSSGSVTVSLPQDIAPTSNVQFNSVTLGSPGNTTSSGISHVQTVDASTNTAAISATGTGHLIVVYAASRNDPNGTGFTNVTDNVGNTYINIPGAFAQLDPSGQNFHIEAWYAKNLIAGATAVTYTPSNGQNVLSFIVSEYSGADINSPLVTSAAINTTSGAPISSSITIINSHDMLVSMALPAITNLTGVYSPWTTRRSGSSGAVGEYSPGTTGTFNANFAPITVQNYASFILEFTSSNTQTTNGKLIFLDTVNSSITVKSPSIVTSYNLILPSSQGGSNSLLQNDGSGNLSWNTAISTTITAIGISTGSLQTQINNLNTSTATLTTRLNNLDSSTSTLTTNITDIAVSTAALTTRLNNLDISTSTLLTQINTKVNYSSFSASSPILYNSATGAFSLGGVSLSTGVTGTLADTSLSSNVDLLTSTQSFTASKTFGNLYASTITVSSNSYVSGSTFTFVDGGLLRTKQIYWADGTIQVSSPSTSGGSSITLSSTQTWTGANTFQNIIITSGTITLGANENANSFKLTNLAAGTVNGDSIRYQQVIGQFLPIGGGNLAGDLGLIGHNIIFYDNQGSPNSVTLGSSATVTTSYTLKWPQLQGGTSTYLKNDGNGNLTWGSVTTDSQTYSGSNTFLNTTTFSSTTIMNVVNVSSNAVLASGTTFYQNGTVVISSISVSTASIANLSGKQLNYTTGTINSFMVNGTATNDSAPTGRIGETISGVNGGFTAAANNVYGDCTSILLTAGDWILSGVMDITTSTTLITAGVFGISTTSGNSGTGLAQGDNRLDINSNWPSSVLPGYRASLASATTEYLKVQLSYTSTAPTIGCKIIATRTR